MSGGPYCYVYDGNGLRVEKFHANGGTCAQPQNKAVDMLYFRAIAGDAISETDGSGNITNEYVLMAGRRIARRNSSGNVYYYYSDAQGSPMTITDSSGNPCYVATYTPYGQEMATTTSCPQNYKFTGYEQDTETGLYYAMARYYSPRLGRFMSPDPLGGGVSDPQSLNRYAYVENNPVNWIDPLGLCTPDDASISVPCFVQEISGGGGGSGGGPPQACLIPWPINFTQCTHDYFGAGCTFDQFMHNVWPCGQGGSGGPSNGGGGDGGGDLPPNSAHEIIRRSPRFRVGFGV